MGGKKNVVETNFGDPMLGLIWSFIWGFNEQQATWMKSQIVGESGAQ
jgi:hypothetical protein